MPCAMGVERIAWRAVRSGSALVDEWPRRDRAEVVGGRSDAGAYPTLGTIRL